VKLALHNNILVRPPFEPATAMENNNMISLGFPVLSSSFSLSFIESLLSAAKQSSTRADEECDDQVVPDL